jgi:diguanylate cyclase (GGDEF)-like protein
MQATTADDQELLEAIRSERFRFFHANRWGAPVGTFFAVSLYSAVVIAAEQVPNGLGWWVVAMSVVMAFQFAAILVPSFTRMTNDEGLPRLAPWGQTLAGIGYGSLMWLDIDLTATSQFRWITLAMVFVVSATVMSGLSGVNSMSRVLLLPMCFVAASGLLVAGQPLSALSLVVFTAIAIRSLRENDKLWTELIELRIVSNRVAEENLWAATHDPMTRLLNRAGMMQNLADRADGPGHPVTLMFIDLDHFKEINDRFGHADGDLVLVETAERLRHSLRGDDVIGRLGGDEFVVLLDGRYDDATSSRLANRIIDDLERPMASTNNDDIYLSASVGIATLPTSEATPERLLLNADHAMYRAKKTGRRQVVHFDAELRDELHERSGLETHLRRAVREGSIEADAQPMFSVDTGRVRAVELLARWRLSAGASVPPNVFIPLAEEIGLISDLTRSMLRTAGELLVAWRDDPILRDSSVTVNVSSVEFARGRLVASVADTITEFGIEPGRLFLEITESHELLGDGADLDQFRALSALGVRFAIDDFGTGYSSLDHLLRLPIDAVKLDLSLIAKLGVDPRQTALVRSIYDLASVVGNSVVAEGVETAAQLAELETIGATLAQGYYLCRPVPARELADHLAALQPDVGVLDLDR